MTSCSFPILRFLWPNISRRRSSVDVAEWACKSAHGVTLGDVGELCLEHGSQRHVVVQGTVAAGRRVQEGDGIGKSVLAVFDVLVLPDPPNTIDLSVMD